MCSKTHWNVVIHSVHSSPVPIPRQLVHSEEGWESDPDSRACGSLLEATEWMFRMSCTQRKGKSERGRERGGERERKREREKGG